MRSKWSTLAARKCRSGSFSHILPGSHSTEVAILRPGLPFPEHLRAYLSAKPDSSSKLSGSFPLIRLCSESRSFLPDLNFRLSTGRTGAASPKADRQRRVPLLVHFLWNRTAFLSRIPEKVVYRLRQGGLSLPQKENGATAVTPLSETRFLPFCGRTGAYRPSRKASSRSMASFSSSSGRT